MAKKEWPQKWKDSSTKYNNEHYSVIGTKLTREKADQFRSYCKENGKSVSAVLAEYVNSVLSSLDNNSEIAGQQNDTPGTVDLPTANETPGTVD